MPQREPYGLARRDLAVAPGVLERPRVRPVRGEDGSPQVLTEGRQDVEAQRPVGPRAIAERAPPKCAVVDHLLGRRSSVAASDVNRCIDVARTDEERELRMPRHVVETGFDLESDVQRPRSY